MRVPGNERAFTVSPARGIPFPQLVCIGAAAGQSQAFPVSTRARLAAAGSWNWPARPRRRRRRCALLYAAGVESQWPPRPSGAPREPASTHTHAQAHTLPEAPPRCRPRPCGFAHTHCCAAVGQGVAVCSGVTGGRGPGTEEADGRGGRQAGRTRAASCPRSGPARRPARGKRPAHPGHTAASARLPGPEFSGGPSSYAGAHGRASASPVWVRLDHEGTGGPGARAQSGSARPQGSLGGGNWWR